MKKIKRLTAIAISFMLSFPYLLMAQDEGTYIDNLNVQDSSYMQQNVAEGAEKSSSGNIAIIIIVAVIIVAVVVFFLMKKKKK